MKAIRLLVIATLFGWAGLAQAGNIDCDARYHDNVELDAPSGIYADCKLGHTNNDNDKDPLFVNNDNMFGGGWEWIDKDDDPGATMEGTLQLASYWGDYNELMIVFKGSNSSGTDPQNYVGYLVPSGTGSVYYMTPFAKWDVELKIWKAQAISHISIYGRGEGQEVPEPATLALLGLGLMGAGMARRRKARA